MSNPNRTNSDKYWKLLIIGLVVISLISLCQYLPSCEPTTRTIGVVPAETIRTEKRQILNADSLNSATQAKIRFAIDSTVKATESRQIREKIVYRYIKIQDEQLEADFHAGTGSADSVIISKNKRIQAGETLLARCDSLRGLDSLKIGSYEAELEGKNIAIGLLSGTIDKAVKGLEEQDKQLQQEKTKVKNRNTLLKIGGGIIAVLAGIVAIK